MKSGKSSVLEATHGPREAALAQSGWHGERALPARLNGRERWCLPSGAGLAEFAMQSGFLASRLWEESRRSEQERGARLPEEAR